MMDLQFERFRETASMNLHTNSSGPLTTGRQEVASLVECWRTAPYLHDGRYVTIRELLVEGRHGLRGARFKNLTEQELDDLIASRNRFRLGSKHCKNRGHLNVRKPLLLGIPCTRTINGLETDLAVR